MCASYCIAAGLAAFGQQLTVDRSSVSMDEPVIIRASFPTGNRGTIRLDADGLTVRLSSSSGCMQCVWIGTVQRPGRLSVGPVYAGDGRVLIDERRTIDVLPAPAIPSDDPKRSMAVMRQSRLIPAYVRAEVRPPRVMSGQQAIVTYWLITEDARIHDATVAAAPVLAKARVYPLDENRVRWNPEPIEEGSSIRKSVVRRFVVVPHEAGTLRIEPFEVTGIMAPEDVGPERLFHEPSARRLSPPVTIEVAPRDAAIDVIASSPRLIAITEDRPGASQQLLVVLGGFGELQDVPTPRFASPLDPNVTVRIEDVGATFEVVGTGLRSQHQWRMWFSAKKGYATNLPPITLRAFDPQSNETVELSTKLDVYVTAAVAPVTPPAPPPATERVKRPLLAARDFFNRWEWLLLVVAGAYAWRVMRASR